MNNNKFNSQNNEFKEFMGASDVKPPEDLTRSILDLVKKDLTPSKHYVLLKIFIIQFFSGLSTLFICSQFGVSFFEIKGLWLLFQKLGDLACMGLCGGLFIGAGALSTMFVLRPEEIRTIWKEKVIIYLFLSLFYLLIFYILGEQHNSASMFIAWFIGAIIASQLIVRVVKNMRFPHWDPTAGVMV